MYVVMVAPECAPAAKAGGLGDVVSGLSRELELRGNAVEIILPKYAGLRYSDIWEPRPCYHDLQVPWHGGAVRCTVWFGYANGRKCFFIEPHSAAGFFSRDRLYGYADDAERFAFFSKAALEFMVRADKRPDVIHCHDWQTGLVPVLLYEQYGQVMADQRVCYTIHNFRHQGTSDEQVLWATGLGHTDYFLDADRLGDDFRYRGLNPMKGGILYSNFVTTVSPNHADEALHDDGACGLGRALKEHQDRFRGVLNGVDYDVWNPQTDPYLPAHYSIENIERKQENKKALRDRFWLRETDGPVVAYVGRLDEQKGMHLVHHALFYTLARRGQFILIGDAHYHDGITDHFGHLKSYLNNNPGLPPGDRVPRGPGAPGLRGRGPAGGAQHVRAVRAGSADRDAVRDGTRGAGHRRHGRHRVRLRPFRAPAGRAQRIRLPPHRQPGPRIRAGPRAPAVVRPPA
jgi:starch synthase